MSLASPLPSWGAGPVRICARHAPTPPAPHDSGKRAELTKIELDTVSDDTKAYVQVGKMFLYQPLPDVKAKLATTVEEVTKEVKQMKEKQEHIKEV